MNIRKIVEHKDIVGYLEKRGLIAKYKKAKDFLLSENFGMVDLKKRKPKQDGIWQFRIDKQFRAFCYVETETLIVFHIDNH